MNEQLVQTRIHMPLAAVQQQMVSVRAELDRILITYGGMRVVRAGAADDLSDYYDDMIRWRGFLMAGRITMMPGRPNECHKNVAKLWREKKCDRIFTGYYLHPDGLWRRHSWGRQKLRIIETTVAAPVYYGVGLSDEEAELFCMEEWA